MRYPWMLLLLVLLSGCADKKTGRVGIKDGRGLVIPPQEAAVYVLPPATAEAAIAAGRARRAEIVGRKEADYQRQLAAIEIKVADMEKRVTVAREEYEMAAKLRNERHEKEYPAVSQPESGIRGGQEYKDYLVRQKAKIQRWEAELNAPVDAAGAKFRSLGLESLKLRQEADALRKLRPVPQELHVAFVSSLRIHLPDPVATTDMDGEFQVKLPRDHVILILEEGERRDWYRLWLVPGSVAHGRNLPLIDQHYLVKSP